MNFKNHLKDILLILPLLASVSKAQTGNIDNAVMKLNAGTFLVSDGGIIIQNAGSVDNSGTIRLKADWTNDALGLINSSPGTVDFNGNFNQVIGGISITNFYNLNINNAAGVTLGNNENVGSALIFNTGKINTGADTLSLTANPPVAISGANANSYVNGNLRVAYSAGNTTMKYEIGGSVYAPVTLAMRGVATPGSITGFTAAGLSPNENNPVANASQVATNARADQYWLINNAGTTFTDYDVTFDFSNTANTGTPAFYIVRKFDVPSTWSSAVSNVTGNTITASGLTSFSEFVVGEQTGFVSVGDIHRGYGKVELYPNPSHGNITLKFSSPSSSLCTIRLTDMTGRVVMMDEVASAKGLNLYQMSTASLAKGIYTISIQNEGEQQETARMAVE